MYQNTLPDLKEEVEQYCRKKNGVFVLIDNLDKGWNPSGLEDSDVAMIRSLLDAGRKLDRDFRRKEVDFHCVVFLRNDVHDILVSETPDRGKETQALVDWSNRELLEQMVRMRLLYNFVGETVSVRELWNKVCVPLIGGEDTLDYLISRSLMRPRFLLHLINYAKGNAINFGRERIDEGDIESALEVYSNGVVTQIDHEIRDVLPEAADVLYGLLEAPAEMRRSELNQLMSRKIADESRRNAALTLLLWHGVLGLRRGKDDLVFIYDVTYNLKRLQGLIENRAAGDPILCINPAFWRGLEVKQ